MHECERVSRGNGCIPGRSKLFSHQTAYPGGTQRLLSGTKLKSPPGKKKKTPTTPKQTIQSNVKPQLRKGTRIKKSEVSQKNIPAARNCIYAICFVKWVGAGRASKDVEKYLHIRKKAMLCVDWKGADFHNLSFLAFVELLKHHNNHSGSQCRLQRPPAS